MSWSFILAVLGFVVNFAAGVLMCVGRNISHQKKKKKKRKSKKRDVIRGRDNMAAEEVQMEERNTTRKSVWTSRDGPEIDPPEYTSKKRPLPS